VRSRAINNAGKGDIDFARGFDIPAHELTAEFTRRRLHFPPFKFEIRRPGIAQPRNGGRWRDQLMQQRQALGLQRSGRKAHGRKIAARPAEAGYKPARDWITTADEHDWDGRGSSPGRAHGGICANDHCYVPLH
jgi:hypothetical protein